MKPRPIRPHLDLYIVFLNVEADAELINPLRGPKRSRPRLTFVAIYRISTHRANPSPRRLTPLAKLSPNPKRVSGPPAHVVNVVRLPLIA